MDLPAFIVQTIGLSANLLIFIGFAYYFLRLRKKEEELDRKLENMDTDYHKVVDNALTKERKIIEDAGNTYNQIMYNALSEERQLVDDATREASQIITGAQYINRAAKGTVDQALDHMIDDIKKGILDTARDFLNDYQASLKLVTDQSLTDFQKVSKGLETDLQKQTDDFQNVAKELKEDLQKQITNFHDTVLPALEKELEDYKQMRLNQTEQTIKSVVQKVSQEILNKSISLDDHQKLLLDSLEKAKKEGMFN